MRSIMIRPKKFENEFVRLVINSRNCLVTRSKMITLGIATGVRCPCCGARTLSVRCAMELCPICWWEDDGQDSDDAFEVRATVNGDLSLAEARLNYQLFGASHPRFARYVRIAKPSEA